MKKRTAGRKSGAPNFGGTGGIQRRNFDIRPVKRNSEPDEEKEDELEERDDELDEEEKEDELEERDDELDEDEEKDELEERDDGLDDEDKEEEGIDTSDEGEPQEGEEGSGFDEDSAGDSDDEEKEEEERMVVEGYATTFNSPYQLMRGGGVALYEQVDARALDGADMSDVILQYDHGGRVFARQSNGTLLLKCDARGLRIRADLGGTAEGRKLFEEIRGGYTNKMSLSFTIDDEETEELPEERILGFSTGSSDRCFLRTIRKIGRVFDVSAVSIPANGGTDIEARSALAQADGKAARERLALEIELEMSI